MQEIAQNLAYQALLAGYAVRFTSASAMLNELAAQDSSRSLQRRLRRYVNPTLLVVDEVGYLSYDNRHADLLFEVVTQRYQQWSVMIYVTWNQPQQVLRGVERGLPRRGLRRDPHRQAHPQC